MKYICPLLVVENIAVSRSFYETLLGQTVKFDFGENITFEGDFAIHEKKHYASLLGENKEPLIQTGAHNFELYFEEEDVIGLSEKLEKENIRLVHDVREQPWGQRVVRFYDPDHHIIEVGERMETLVVRLFQQGLSKEDIEKKTMMPMSFVEKSLGHL